MVWLLTFCAGAIQAQSQQQMAKADSVTYAIYMTGDWDQLIEEGRKFLAEDIDFYYLRMRMAWAYSQKKQYRLAIPHYRKALKFMPDDVYALLYLMYAYEYSGRAYDAHAISAKLNPVLHPALVKKYKTPLVGSGVFFTYNASNSDNTQKKMNMNPHLDTDGIQKTTNNYTITSAYLGHRLARNMILYHSVSYLKKNDHTYIISDSALYEQEAQDLYQWSYNAQLCIRVANGLNVIPVYNHVHFEIPSNVSGYSDYIESSDIFGGIISKDFNYFKIGLSFTTGKMNMADQNQVGVHLTIFPRGNLNLYYAFDGYFQNQEVTGVSLSNFIHKHVLGFRVTDHWWMEASGMFPKFHNFYETSTGSLWNGLEGTKNLVNWNHIFLTKNSHLSFILNLGLYESESVFVPTDDISNRQNAQSYLNINITGGIVWKL